MGVFLALARPLRILVQASMCRVALVLGPGNHFEAIRMICMCHVKTVYNLSDRGSKVQVALSAHCLNLGRC